jgi:CRISPR/Cas system Type II protein with McrA/HNH and RuvC-like nuclease domain
MTYDIQKMKELRKQGKTYVEISEIMGCSEWTVKYQLIPNRKKNQNRYYNKKSINDPLYFKRKHFMSHGAIVPFSLKDLKSKIEKKQKCYITGEPIDLLKPETYSLDHKIPVSRGGGSSLENLGLCKADINQAKYNLTDEEFLELCQRVVIGRECE